MTIFLTGATGFVGSAVLRRLLDADREVRVLARPGGDRRNIDGLRCEIIEGDLVDSASYKYGLKGCEAVFHVAADYRLWAPDAAKMHRINIDGTRDLFRLASEMGAKRIVYTSSVATLGLNADGTPADEDTPSVLDDMIGTYKRSKFCAEEEVQRLVAEEGIPAITVNPSAPIGPRDLKPTPTGRIIVDAASGKMPAYVDTGLNFVHVEDVADGHLKAFEKGEVGDRYILGGENITLLQILTEICAYVGRKPPAIKLPQAALLPIAYVAEGLSRLTGNWEPFVTVDGVKMSTKRMYFSSKKAEESLGYKARPAKEAVADAIDWYRNNGYLK
ncbi:MAG TPA: NAD-dependent dehydratase [Rhodospirillaceae bacterium]|nr:NAD-dependent dehydratase [Rhodospirillaceae bacterium]HAA93267.1 NAD-dependent dehydratase [Rhodospirillaceae bacterium]HAT34958.1 NAD-dependent dehydratase [Rhodospirillaceae bacterium]